MLGSEADNVPECATAPTPASMVAPVREAAKVPGFGGFGLEKVESAFCDRILWEPTFLS